VGPGTYKGEPFQQLIMTSGVFGQFVIDKGKTKCSASRSGTRGGEDRVSE